MFSGIGGFELGIQRAYEFTTSGRQEQSELEYKSIVANITGQCSKQGSISCIGFSEIDKYAVQIYKNHFTEHINYGDATRIIPEQLPDFDLLCGGFPCQAFSIAGKRLGFDDTRGTLFFEIARILKVKRPRMFLLENVKGLLSHDNGRTFKTIITTLVELGYGVEWQVLNSKDFGVPQNRERVFIVGHLGGIGGGKVFPICGTDTTDREVNIIGHRKNYRKNTQVFDGAGITEALDTGAGGGRGQYTETMTSIRRLTPTECERLQSFPDGWTSGISDSQRYKCLGNAVTVNVIEAIVRKLT